MKTPAQTSVWLGYDDNPRAPKNGVMIHTDVGSRPFTALAATVYGSIDDIHKLVLGDYQYPFGTARIVEMVKTMVETGETPPGLSDMVEAIAVIEAFKKAEQTGEAVRVSDFL